MSERTTGATEQFVKLTPWDREAIAFIEWWMTLNKKDKRLGGTLTESLKSLRGTMRQLKIARKPTDQMVYTGIPAIEPIPGMVIVPASSVPDATVRAAMKQAVYDLGLIVKYDLFARSPHGQTEKTIGAIDAINDWLDAQEGE